VNRYEHTEMTSFNNDLQNT